MSLILPFTAVKIPLLTIFSANLIRLILHSWTIAPNWLWWWHNRSLPSRILLITRHWWALRPIRLLPISCWWLVRHYPVRARHPVLRWIIRHWKRLWTLLPPLLLLPPIRGCLIVRRLCVLRPRHPIWWWVAAGVHAG